MQMALNAKKKLEFMDGSLEKLAEIESTSCIQSRCNNMVISWILNAASKEIADSLLYLETVEAVQRDLHDRLRQSNAPCIF